LKIAYGTKVEDKFGNYIGQVNHVIRDRWTGGVRKFGVWHPEYGRDVLVSPEDIAEMKQDKIVLAVSLEKSS